LETSASWQAALCVARLSLSSLQAVTHVIKTHYGFEDRQIESFMKVVLGTGNLCVLGQAGVGKSYMLLKAIEVLKLVGANVLCTAPTRIAAGLFGDCGCTLAKALSIRPVPAHGVVTVDTRVAPTTKGCFSSHRHTPAFIAAEIARLTRAREMAERDACDAGEEETPSEVWLPMLGPATDVRAADVLVVDEAMTLNEFKFLQMLSILRFYRQDMPKSRRLPMLVFAGDHMQCSPIPLKDSRVTTNLGQFCFTTDEFKRFFPLETNVIELDIVKRASHQAYLRLLKSLRTARPLTKTEVEEWHAITGPAAERLVPMASDPAPTDDTRAQLRIATAAIIAHNQTPSFRQRHQPPLDDRFPARESWKEFVNRCHPAPKRCYHAADAPDERGNRVTALPALPARVELFLGCPVKGYVVDRDDPLKRESFYAFRRELRGVVTAMEDGHIMVDTGTASECIPTVTVQQKYDRAVRTASRTGLPVVAEPALTAHGCQGKTYRHEHRVFVETPWERNQLYVALSRAVHPGLIRIAGSMASITNRVHESLLQFQVALDAVMAARGKVPWVGLRR
jgi:hypothetical protein